MSTAKTYANAFLSITFEPLSDQDAICTLRPLLPVPITADIVRVNNQLFMEHCYPHNRVIVDGGKNVRFMDRAARHEANDPRLAPLTLCMALLVQTPASAAVANFFLHVVKTPYPLRIFHDGAKARAWLLSHPLPAPERTDDDQTGDQT